MKKKTASTIICENFKIPQQTIFQDYKCSFKSGLTYFGRLYIGEEYVCFISNMFGIIKKCIIQIEKIQKLQEPAKNSLMIEQTQGTTPTTYNFSGFKSDHAYKLIKALWKKQKIESEVLNSHQEDQNINLVASEVGKQKLLDEGNVQSSFFNPKFNEADRQKLCEFQLPCSVEQYYEFFLADNATVYPRKVHMQKKDAKQMIVTPWRKNQQLQSQVRQLSGMIRVHGVPFLSYAHMNQVWKLKRNQNNELQIEMVVQMSDVPFSSNFVVNTHLTIIKDGETKCKMIAQSSIVFHKTTYMKGKIISKTLADLIEDMQFWVANVKQILAKMKKSQQQEFRSTKSIKMSSTKDIEYEVNMPILSSQKHLNTPDQYQMKATVSRNSTAGNEQWTKINKKIDILSKLVIIMIVLMILNLIISGIGIFGSQNQCRAIEYNN